VPRNAAPVDTASVLGQSMAVAKFLENRLADLDPGGIQTVRGIHIALATAAAAGAFYAIHAWSGIAGIPDLAIVAASVAGHGLMFTAPGSRTRELKSLLRNIAVFMAVFGAAIVIGWGNLDPGGTLVTIAWVPVISFALFLRRYGLPGSQSGSAMALMFMFVVLLNPTRETAIWLPLACVVGALSAILFRIVSWRPSSVTAFKVQRDAIYSALAERIAVAGKQDAQAFSVSDLRSRWIMLAKISKTSTHEFPDQADEINSDVTKVLRLLMAAQYLSDIYRAILSDHRADLVRQRDYSAVQSSLARSLASDGSPSGDLSERMADLRARIVETDVTLLSKNYYPLQLYSGYVHLFDILTKVAQRPSISENQQNPKSVDPWLSHVGNRLALQGFAAAAVTTSLSLFFNLQNGYWATLTVIIIMVGTAGATMTKLVNRTIGTFAGAVVAICVQLLFDSAPFEAITALIALAAIFTMLERHYIAASALTSYVILTSSHLIYGAGLTVELSRVYETALGAVAGFLSAWLLFPIRSADRIVDRTELLVDKTAELIRLLGQSGTHDIERLTTLEQEAQSIALALPELEAERILSLQAPNNLRIHLAHADALISYTAHYADTYVKARHFASDGEAATCLGEIQRALEAAFGSSVESAQSASVDIAAIPLPKPGTAPRRAVLALVGARYCASKTAQLLTDLQNIS
jgi:hypothetical protein